MSLPFPTVRRANVARISFDVMAFDHHCHLELIAAMLTESYTGKIEGT